MTVKIAKENLSRFFDTVSERFPLFMPLRKRENTDYGYYEKGSEFDLETLKTSKSPKNVFFPQSENMMKFRTEGKKIEIEDIREEKAPFVLFGVKACDYRAISLLDNVFLQEPVDTYYKIRRDAAVIFTLCCGNPKDSCFCNAFGIDATNPGGDAVCAFEGNYLYIETKSEKAEKVLENIGDILEKADFSETEKTRGETAEKIKLLPFANLDLSRFTPDHLNELFSDPAWNDLSESCLGCGACTFVCPTCQCFDIRDFKTDRDVLRFRCWDSCMYSDFTQMAGANPRTTQMQRFRQRFMHKLVYYPSQYGSYSCVGCGRCVDKCPQRLNIVKVIRKIGGEKK